MRWSGIDADSGVEFDLDVKGREGQSQVIHFKGISRGEDHFSLSSITLENVPENFIVKKCFIGAISGRVIEIQTVNFSYGERKGIVGRIDANFDETLRDFMYPKFVRREGNVDPISREIMSDSVVSLVIRDCRYNVPMEGVPILKIDKNECSENLHADIPLGVNVDQSDSDKEEEESLVIEVLEEDEEEEEEVEE